MLIVDVSEVKLPVQAKQNNIPPECAGQDEGVIVATRMFVGNNIL
jgi:hypothetical protein